MHFLPYIRVFSMHSLETSACSVSSLVPFVLSVPISSEHCEVILRQRSTEDLGAALSEFMWCCFASGGLDRAKRGGLRKQETHTGKAHIPNTHREMTHIIQNELGPLCLSPHGDFWEKPVKVFLGML